MRANPFATRFTRPGVVPFLFPDGESVETVVAKLQMANWWGEIVGPHGSGKSTLVAGIKPELTRQGRQVEHLVFHRGGSISASWPANTKAWTPQTQVLVDGFEQLSWWQRWRLKRSCHKSKSGLLITTHQSCGLTCIFKTHPSPELAESLVKHLLPPEDRTIDSHDIRDLCRQYPTNLREVLFGLYDLYQERSP